MEDMKENVNKSMGLKPGGLRSGLRSTGNSAGNPAGNFPEKKFRAGGVAATIWLNKGQRPNGEESEYKTISIERVYKDRDGQWQSTNSLRVNDLPKLQLVLQHAYAYVLLGQQNLPGQTLAVGAGLGGV